VLGLKKAAGIPGVMSFFTTQSNSDSHDLALMRVGPDAPAPDPRGVGLYHFSYQVASEADLAEAYRTLQEAGVPITGTADHGVSKGIYITDPDGIEIEITYEVPREQWPEAVDPFAQRPRPLVLA
jgi:catechol-2,3-dioxygenase